MSADDGRQNEDTEEKVRDRFAGLTVFEPSQESLDMLALERAMKDQEDNAIYEAETEATFEHALFALVNVVNDMNRVRARIRWIWSNYQDGAFDLAAAAIASNTAIELVKTMTEDIMPLLDSQGGLGFMLNQFHLVQCLIEGWTLERISADARDDRNYATYDVASATYLTVYRMLEGFATVLQPNKVPMYKEGIYGVYDPASDRSRKTGQEKFNDDRALLTPYFTELMTAIRGYNEWPVKDAFLLGVEELSTTNHVPFYAVFAAQVFLDVTYELREDIERPFRTMLTHTAVMDDDIKAHFKFHARLKNDAWPLTDDLSMRVIHRSIQQVREDPLRTLQADLYERMGTKLPDKESHRLFRMSPITSGLFLYHFRARYREVGFGIADAWGSIQYSGHLYNALQTEKLLRARWIDMDFLAAKLGEESFYFGGEAPKTLPDYFEKFCLQMGTSAAAMVKGRHKDTPVEFQAGPRRLKRTSPVLSTFKARYVDNSCQVDFTPELVSQIIELGRVGKEGAEDDSFVMVQIENPNKSQEKKKKLQQPKNQARGKPAQSGTIPLEQLIKPLVRALHAETLEYVYPYLSMHRWCWRLLRAVKNSCDTALTQLYTSTYLEEESWLPWVVGWIFLAASDLEDGGACDRRPLLMAAEATNRFFDSGVSGTCKRIIEERLGIPVEVEKEGGGDQGQSG
ncbi:hypothetical protein F5B17DRAFT_404497 [Nemania serpens]|nr:hypothetical protein F5B17DRAFT_404497 [Nemania serpens]